MRFLILPGPAVGTARAYWSALVVDDFEEDTARTFFLKLVANSVVRSRDAVIMAIHDSVDTNGKTRPGSVWARIYEVWASTTCDHLKGG